MQESPLPSHTWSDAGIYTVLICARLKICMETPLVFLGRNTREAALGANPSLSSRYSSYIA